MSIKICLNFFLIQEQVHFTENIDIVTYKDGKRETHNDVGRAFPAIVWDYYQVGTVTSIKKYGVIIKII